MLKKINSFKTTIILFLLTMAILAFGGGMFLSMANAADKNVTEVKLTVDFSPYEDKFPVGVVGKTYTVFSSSAVDNFGNKVQVDITVFGPDGTVVPLVGDKFLTDTAGIYTIKYTATVGAICDVENVDVKVEETCEPLNYVFNEKIAEEGTTGEMFYVYPGESFGGSGLIEETPKVLLGETEVELVDAGIYSYFIPRQMGEYSLVYTLVDFVGNQSQSTKTITITDSSAPILNEASVSKLNKLGDVVKLPVVDAIMYDNGQTCYVPVKVYYDDTEITKTMAYTANEVGEHTVKYVATNPNDATFIAEKSYNVSVINSAEIDLYVENYLKLNNFTGSYPSYSDGYLMTVVEDGDASFDFKSKIYEEFLSLEFGVYDVHTSSINDLGDVVGKLSLNKLTFDAIKLSFTDSKLGSQKITLTIVNEDNKMIVYNRGQICYISNDNLMQELADGLYIKYDYATKNIVDNMDNVILDVKYFDNGEPFNGFKSDYAYINAGFVNATANTVLCLRGVANDTISDATSDRMKPKFYLSQELSGSISADIGQTITLTCPKAFDLYDENVVYNIKVINQGTKATIFDDEVDGSYDFLVTEYGEYKVEFYAKDSRNQQRRIMTIRVVDRIAPTVKVSEVKATAKVGEEITIPTMVVTDNCDVQDDCITYTYVSYGNFLKYMVYDTYKFEQAGEHVFTFTAWDKNSNCTTVKYTVMVTE